MHKEFEYTLEIILMTNIKTIQVRRNFAPNSYYFDLRTEDTLMQEYDVQTGTWKPDVTTRDTWRTLLLGTVKKASVDGTGTVEDATVATCKWWYRAAGAAEWKDLDDNYHPIYGMIFNGGVILRQQANIPAGVVYEVKCIVGIADTDIKATVTLESDIYRIGCNDKTLDEIRFRLVKGQQNIIYNPEAPAPYTVEGLEKATFLQQTEFEITRGGQKFNSDEVTVEAVNADGSYISEGVDLSYNFSSWSYLYNTNSSGVPDAKTDQIGNSVHFVDRYIGVHADTWSIGKGGLFTYAPGSRKIDILWKGKIERIEFTLQDGTSGGAPKEEWITLDQVAKGEMEYSISGGTMKATCYVTDQGNSITTKGLTFSVVRLVVITNIRIIGVDAEDALHTTEAGGLYYKGYCITSGDNEQRLMANDFTRSILQKLSNVNGKVTVTMDCGAKYSGAVVIRLKNKDGSVLYDERVISFQRKVPQLEVSVANSVFIESKGTANPKVQLKLFAEGHEVYNYNFYSVAVTAKKADGETEELRIYTYSYGADGITYYLPEKTAGTVTFTAKMIERLDVGIV